MKLLHVVPTYAPGFRYGGPVASVRGLAEAQVRAGHKVWVATTDRDDGARLDAPEAETLGGVEVRRFAVRGPSRLRRAPAMRRWFAREVAGFDRVHTHGVFVFTTTWALDAARRAGVPAVLAPRGMWMDDAFGTRGRWRKHLWLAALERQNLVSLEALHLTAHLELEQLQSHLAPGARRIVVPNGVEAPTAPVGREWLPHVAETLFASGAGYGLFLGRLHWKKGLDVLLRELSRAPDAPPLLVAGPDDGAEQACRRLAGELGLGGRVHWLGPVAGEAKWALLQHASLHLLPSRSENFGNTVLESLAVGCPVLVTPEVGAKDAVLELEGGRVLPAEQFGAAMGTLTASWRDPERRRQLAARTASLYGWDSIAARLEDALMDSALGAA